MYVYRWRGNKYVIAFTLKHSDTNLKYMKSEVPSGILIVQSTFKLFIHYELHHRTSVGSGVPTGVQNMRRCEEG
jgi:hypothetical protein